jgi:hypothetical protein
MTLKLKSNGSTLSPVAMDGRTRIGSTDVASVHSHGSYYSQEEDSSDEEL